MSRETEAGTVASALQRSSPLGRRRRLMTTMVVIAVAAAGLGWSASAVTQSPGEADLYSLPPEPSLVTASVEHRTLSSTIVTRGDGRFAGSTELLVDVDLGATGGARPLVTGRLPQVGDELPEGAVAIEVSGRPVFLLGGDLPMYRELGPGSQGPDVAQLEEALLRLGYAPGTVDQTYDEATARAVDAFYRAAGYQPARVSEDQADQLAIAQEQEQIAQDALDDARDALERAREGPSRVELIAAEADVVIAEAEVDRAVADRDEAVAKAPPEDRDRVRREHDLIVLRADRQLAVAQARLDDLEAPPDTAAEQGAVDRAGEALRRARERVRLLREGHGTAAGRGEIVFLPDLPRQVEEVQVGLGAEPSGPVLRLSGAELLVETTVSAAERPLLAVGDQVWLDEETLGIDLTGRIASVSEVAGEASSTVQIRPDRPAGDSSETRFLAGVNVRVTIPVESTDGEVLAVPAAAVWTSVDGTSWVRVRSSGDATRDVAVRVGLAAEGLLEVTPVVDGLGPGDDVVLGLR